MTKSVSEKKKKMVYTPEHHIPLGEAIKTDSGDYGLRIKRDKQYETVSISQLMSQIIQTVDSKT